MNYLLDTHTFLWSIFESQRLPSRVQAIILDPTQDIMVSAVSLWEISLKHRLGKLDMNGYNPSDMLELCQKMQYQLLPITPEEAGTYHELGSDFHKDPFDRMLIHQSIQQRLVLLSKDPVVHQYAIEGLKVVWE